MQNFLKNTWDMFIETFQEIYEFFYDIIASCYNFLNRYIPAEGLLAIGILLGAFIICVTFIKIINR